MSFGTPVSQGAASGSGANSALVTTVTVFAGSLVVVYANEDNTAGSGTVADNVGGNTYTLLTTAINGIRRGMMFYCVVANTIAAGSTITYTRVGAGNTSMSVLSAAGVDVVNPVDSAVTATAVGTSNAPTVTSGVPTKTFELIVVGMAHTNPGTFTDDTTHGWTTPPFAPSTAIVTCEIHGSYQLNTTLAAKTYAPTFTAAPDWRLVIAGFNPLAEPIINVLEIARKPRRMVAY